VLIWVLATRRAVVQDHGMKMLDARQTLGTSSEYIGYWWLPSDPKSAVAGTLRYAPETGCTLELMGYVGDAQLDGPIARLDGASPAGDQITLLQVVPTKNRFVQDTFPTIQYTCAVALVGNYHPPDDLQFSKSVVRFEHLEQWAHVRHVHQEHLQGRRGVSFTVEVGEHGELCARAGYTVTAQSGFNASANDRSIRLDAFTALRIEPNEVRDLEWFIEETRALRDLAALSIGLPQPLTSLRLYGGQREVAPALSATEEVFAYFWEETPARRSRGSYPLIAYQRLRIVAPDILDRWKSVRDKYRDVIDLVLVVMSGHHTTSEVGFLLTMQAFEAFDRLRSPRELVPQDVFEVARQAMAAAIPSSAPTELRRKLSDSIKFANEPSLRQRLKAFHRRLSEELGEEPLGLGRPTIDRLVDTRNFYTHYAEELRPAILTPEGQADETERFCALLILSVLQEAGVPYAETLRGLDFHERFRRYGRSYREGLLETARKLGDA